MISASKDKTQMSSQNVMYFSPLHPGVRGLAGLHSLSFLKSSVCQECPCPGHGARRHDCHNKQDSAAALGRSRPGRDRRPASAGRWGPGCPRGGEAGLVPGHSLPAVKTLGPLALVGSPDCIRFAEAGFPKRACPAGPAVQSSPRARGHPHIHQRRRSRYPRVFAHLDVTEQWTRADCYHMPHA